MSRIRKAWTKDLVKQLKTYARQKTPTETIAKQMKRTPAAIRQKAYSISLSLDTR